MGKKIAIGTGSIFILIVVFVGGYLAGFRLGEMHPQQVLVQGVSGIDEKGNAASVDFSTFWQAWDIIDKNYLNTNSVSVNQRVDGAMAGLVRSLGDPHSEYFNPSDSQKFEQDVEGNFGGIGAEIGTKNERIVVVAPLKNSPAEKAGLKPDDQILMVNSTSTDGLTVEDAVKLIRGAEGTPVTLTIIRSGWKDPKDFKMTRENIQAPTLDYEIRDGNIAYVRLYSFNANAEQLFQEAVLRTLMRGAQGMVLDLRNNPGGYLEVAVDLAGWFIPRGKVVVSEATRVGTDEVFRAQGNAALAEFPVVVLVNGGSASASEILSGALRDLRGTKLIGTKTFGKGTVQKIFTLKDDSSMKITIAHWVMPSGMVLDKEGLQPDIEIEPSDEDLKSGNDVQLTKALSVMQDIIKRSKTYFIYR